jgi:hypothetical protein
MDFLFINLYEKGVDWVDLVQDRDKWWAVLNTLMNILFPQNTANFLTVWGTISFPEAVWCT